MSKTINVQSARQFTDLVSSSTTVVVDFYADWCGPCKAIAPVYEQLSKDLSRPNKITFTKVNVDQQREIAQTYNVTAMPTFLILKNRAETTRIRGANTNQLQAAVKKLAEEAGHADANAGSGQASSSSSSSGWLGAASPRGYADVTEDIDIKGLDLLNADGEFGGTRTLFSGDRPSALGKAGAGGDKSKKDWVESDTDEQLMLFIPFNSTLKIHTLHITSLPPPDQEDVMRPKTLRLYTNSAHNLGFEEAEDIGPTQEVVVGEESWDKGSGTATVELRFVKFQKCSSLVVFVVDGEGSGEKTRVDRLKLFGESGQKRDMGKLEKIGDHPGE